MLPLSNTSNRILINKTFKNLNICHFFKYNFSTKSTTLTHEVSLFQPNLKHPKHLEYTQISVGKILLFAMSNQ